MTNSWLSLLPPIIVLTYAFVSKNLNKSLIIGIVSAALITNDGAPLASLASLYNRLIEQIIDINRIYLYLFLICISILITVFNRTGSAIAFARAITHKLRSKRMVELSAMGLSSALCIDDYLNVLTVGYVMRPMTDRFVIPRAKLAYLIHSLSGPLVILAPISSWVAYITAQLNLAGIAPALSESPKIIGEPFFIYLQTIPFIFYSLILIGSMVFIVYRRLSFGPMRLHEQIAQQTGNLYGGKQAPHATNIPPMNAHGSPLDLLIPLAILVTTVVVGILYAGDYHLLGGSRSLIEAIKHNTKTELILFTAGALSLITSFVLIAIRKTVSLTHIPCLVIEGVHLMVPSIIMVILAMTLGAFLANDLQTGTYLATFLQSAPHALLPCIIFFASVVMAIMTGSSWGTIAILVPISIQILLSLTPAIPPLYAESIPLLLPILGAIFSGSVCGNHISPIAETTIMASTSSGSDPLDHVYTQFPYVLPVIISTGLAFLAAGFLIPHGITTTIIGSLAIGLTTCMLALETLNYMDNKTPND